MKNWIRIPGFPPPEKQDSVRFYLFKGLTYSARMMLYFLFVAAGFFLQVQMMQVWPGAALLLFATLLNLVRGFDSRVRINALDLDRNWTDVDMGRIAEVKALEDRISRWNRDTLDITNGLGCATFFAFAVVLFLAVLFFSGYAGESLIDVLDNMEFGIVGQIIFMDALILLVPLWFNGTRRVLKQGNLRIRIGIIESMEAVFNKEKKDGEIFTPGLMLARDKTGKSVPTNARFTIKYEDMPEGFYGIQAQINLNLVQGTSHPYFYCVIPAKRGFGLKQFVEELPRKGNAIIEYQEDNEAEVIVIRQYTTKTSGYLTNNASCANILTMTMEAARIVLGRV